MLGKKLDQSTSPHPNDEERKRDQRRVFRHTPRSMSLETREQSGVTAAVKPAGGEPHTAARRGLMLGAAAVVWIADNKATCAGGAAECINSYIVNMNVITVCAMAQEGDAHIGHARACISVKAN